MKNDIQSANLGFFVCNSLPEKRGVKIAHKKLCKNFRSLKDNKENLDTVNGMNS